MHVVQKKQRVVSPRRQDVQGNTRANSGPVSLAHAAEMETCVQRHVQELLSSQADEEVVVFRKEERASEITCLEWVLTLGLCGRKEHLVF